MSFGRDRMNVLIAGGGVAALEAMVALKSHASATATIVSTASPEMRSSA